MIKDRYRQLTMEQGTNLISREYMTGTMHISRLVALGGSVLTLVQAILLANESDGICFNSGCAIVDSLTRVPPIFFNIGGFVFFQAVFWGIWLARERRQRLWFVNILLSAGLAAEGVLICFQHLVAQVFCSYCLIIFSLVLLLNILGGWRQIVTASVVFGAVVVGFFSLQFSGARGDILKELDEGSFAVVAGQAGRQKNYLFFSSTCKYCEKVIESLQEENTCAVSFNPVDTISRFSLDKAQRAGRYDTEVNRRFLQSIGIDQIPVLLSMTETGFQVLRGEVAIKEYLQKTCFGAQSATGPAEVIGTSPATGFDFILPPGQDEGCSVYSDCEDPPPVQK
jgi:hypothetical protein